MANVWDISKRKQSTTHSKYVRSNVSIWWWWMKKIGMHKDEIQCAAGTLIHILHPIAAFKWKQSKIKITLLELQELPQNHCASQQCWRLASEVNPNSIQQYHKDYTQSQNDVQTRITTIIAIHSWSWRTKASGFQGIRTSEAIEYLISASLP